MTGHNYRPIDDQVGAAINRLHKRFPKLGHHGLLEALRQDGFHVDPEELKQYMRTHRIKAQRSWRPWKWIGAPSWLGGSADTAPPNLDRQDGGVDDRN